MKTQLHVSLSLPTHTHIRSMHTSITKCRTTTPPYLWPHCVRRVQSPCRASLTYQSPIPHYILASPPHHSPLFDTAASYALSWSAILRSSQETTARTATSTRRFSSSCPPRHSQRSASIEIAKECDLSTSQEKTMCWLLSIGSIEPLRKYSAATSCYCLFIDISW